MAEKMVGSTPIKKKKKKMTRKLQKGCSGMNQLDGKVKNSKELCRTEG